MSLDRQIRNRRQFVVTLGAGALGMTASVGMSGCRPEGSAPAESTDPAEVVVVQEQTLFIGTYTNGDSEGIYQASFNQGTGEISNIRLIAETANPSFMALHPTKPLIFTVNELSEFEGAASGAVSAIEFVRFSSQATVLNQVSSQGGAPCHITVDNSGRWVLIANYLGGNVAVFPIEEDGRLGVPASVFQHEGSSVDSSRQEGPHAHNIILDPAGRFAFSADLGIDKVMIYRFDSQTGALTSNDPAFVSVEPGAGPRHFVFHPSGRFAFVINELNSTMTAFSYDPDNGVLAALDTISTLPAGYSETSYCADIHVHPNGRFVYGTNRGHNSVAIATFDEATGGLSLAGTEPTQGDWPRNFTLDPSGEFLLVANQRSNDIVVFRIDPDTGLLTSTGHVAQTPTPVCLKFA